MSDPTTQNTSTDSTITSAAPPVDPGPSPAPPADEPAPSIPRGLYFAADRFHLADGHQCLCDHPYNGEPMVDRNDQRWSSVPASAFCDRAREALARPGGARPDDDLATKAASGSNTAATQQAITQAQRAPVPFHPKDTAEMFRYAGFLANSTLIPKALQRQPSDVLVVLLKGQDLGLTPMQSISGINVIDGKAEVGALMMVSMIRKSGMCEHWMLVESTNERATYRTKRRGDPQAVDFTYTVEEAREAGLLDKGRDEAAKRRSPWNTQRRTMLRRRCQSMLAREVYPDVVAGLYDHGELQEVRELERELMRAQMEATRAGFAVIDGAEAEAPWMRGDVVDAESAPASTDGAAVQPEPSPDPASGAPAPPARQQASRDPLKDRLRKRAEQARPATASLFEAQCSRCGVPIDPPKPGDSTMCPACTSETSS